MSNVEQMKVLKEGVVRGYEGSLKQFGMEKTNSLSPRKPKNTGKPPKFRLDKSAVVQTSQFEGESTNASKVQGAPKPGLKRLEKLGRFRMRSGPMEVDLSTLSF